MAKKKQENCGSCQDKIVAGMELHMNNRTICLGCAVEKGIAQQLHTPINHMLDCEYDVDSCAECFLNHRDMMTHLGYICTELGTFYKRTNDPKIVVLYE
tara:strand:+ start:48 stop:344 length:297 start_codon:yes stop_codon:yes gene_type:complete